MHGYEIWFLAIVNLNKGNCALLKPSVLSLHNGHLSAWVRFRDQGIKMDQWDGQWVHKIQSKTKFLKRWKVVKIGVWVVEGEWLNVGMFLTKHSISICFYFYSILLLVVFACCVSEKLYSLSILNSLWCKLSKLCGLKQLFTNIERKFYPFSQV